MKDFKDIKDLSKEELLGIIFNHMQNTTYSHPCMCVCCGEKSLDDLVDIFPFIKARHPEAEDDPKFHRLVEPIGYICDLCEARLSEDE